MDIFDTIYNALVEVIKSIQASYDPKGGAKQVYITLAEKRIHRGLNTGID